jgi:uncharacterized protein YdiU (UPF0061 family)
LRGNPEVARSLFDDPSGFNDWTTRWQDRLAQDEAAPTARADAMDRVNPIYIPRNHKVEEALAAAVDLNNLAPFTELLAVLSQPFDEIEGREAYAPPAPVVDTTYQTFCGT